MPYSWLTAACCLAVQYQIVRWQIASFVSLPPGLRAYGFGAVGSLMSRTCRQSPIQPSFGFTAGSVAFTSGVASTTCAPMHSPPASWRNPIRREKFGYSERS